MKNVALGIAIGVFMTLLAFAIIMEDALSKIR